MAMTPVYKGYKGWIPRNPDPESGMYHGKVIGIIDAVTFQGATVQEAWNEFKASIDDWLEFKRMIEGKELYERRLRCNATTSG